MVTAPERLQKIKDWQAANPDRVKTARKRWAGENKAWFRKQWLKRYGLTPESFEDLLQSQDRKCAVCRAADPGKRGWQIDHCHATGRVRGLLCIHCNLALGHLKDRVDLFQAAITYLNG